VRLLARCFRARDGLNRAALRFDQAFDHGGKAGLILPANALELQADSATALGIANGGIGPDFAVFDKKMEFHRRVGGENSGSFDKKATDAQVAYTRSVFGAATAPKYPYALGSFDALVTSTRNDYLLFGWKGEHDLCIQIEIENASRTLNG